MKQLFLNIVECAIEFEGNFFVIERPKGVFAGGLLALPGGKVEPNDGTQEKDPLLSAVKREVFEETGIQIHGSTSYVRSFCFAGTQNMPVINSLFYCKLLEMPKITISKREVSGYDWMSLEQITNTYNAPIWLKNSLKCIQNHSAEK